MIGWTDNTAENGRSYVTTIRLGSFCVQLCISKRKFLSTGSHIFPVESKRKKSHSIPLVFSVLLVLCLPSLFLLLLCKCVRLIRRIPCVASVSVEQRTKNGVFGVLPAQKMEWEPLPHPSPSYFCSRPISRVKTPYFTLCVMETLATQKRWLRRLPAVLKVNFNVFPSVVVWKVKLGAL